MGNFQRRSAKQAADRGRAQPSRAASFGTPTLRKHLNAEAPGEAERIASVPCSELATSSLAQRRSGQQAQTRQSAAAVMRQRVNIDITRLRSPGGGQQEVMTWKNANAHGPRPSHESKGIM